ncbi:MAG: hypothetical protein HXS44_07610 [Theionarchaea archaeon]|nr:hypothetical protein [Theionarchaea archaeon]
MNSDECKNEISGGRKQKLSYVYTDDGIKLPVLDITHPLFIESIDEEHLPDLQKESAQGVKNLREMPDSLKKYLGENSLIYRGFFLKNPNETSLSGMSTLMSKLGPHLIGNGKERAIDREASQGIGPVAARLRLRDICLLQARALIPQLTGSKKDLCFINIAGGTATDSTNTLILILKENQSLLKGRKIEICVFDSDTRGPHFAGQCIRALKAPECYFHDLNISSNHIHYNWADTRELVKFLSKRKESIMMCASEGGLFEYATNEEIVDNLNSLYDYSPDEMKIVGDTFHDLETVDPTIPAVGEVCGMSFRFLGTEGLNRILDETNWKLDFKIEKNPIYVIFVLKKDIK